MFKTRQFGTICKCKSVRRVVEVGQRHTSKKQQEEGMPGTPIYEKFWSVSPIGYRMKHIRNILKEAVEGVIQKKRKRVELNLQRYPQVNTAMGEILNGIPKDKRPSFGYTTDKEDNTLFVISA